GGNYHDITAPFPGKLYNWIDNAKVENQLKFLVLTLEHIIRLMESRESSMNAVQWNQNTLQHFLAGLSRQSSELKECVAQYPSRKESYERKIKSHFRKLDKILKKEKYSAQAWEKIRRAVKHHLQRMDIIASNAMSFLKV
ncbi:hypothetical protein PO909_001892, partial [Leuciscus waleckii]